MSSPAPTRRKKSYALHWALVGAAAAALVLPRLTARLSPPRRAPAAASDWFLALRLPLLTEPDVRRREELARLDDWLGALKRAGYAPVLLSEARARLARGERLPGKPVVLVIEPGYRRTYDAVLPFLAARRVPAVWLVDGAAVARLDERYLSPHALEDLRAAPLSDTGFIQGSTRTFTLAGTELTWRDNEGRTALNQGADLRSLNRLNVNFAWTGSQLVSRLEAETPVSGAARLTTARLYGKIWGVIADGQARGGAAFDLAAPFASRSASITWQGTARCRDLALQVAADALVGDLWIYLRYDRRERRGVRVGFTPGLVLAEEWRDGDWKRLGSFARAAASGAPLHSTIRLEGARLDVASDDGTERAFDLAPSPRPRPGVIMLQSYDKVRGVAGVRALTLALKPS